MTERTPIPSGTVTLLFTDIQGSTRMWEAEPERMALALRRHDEALRAAIESADGYVFKTVGDAFCAAFGTASRAVASALAAQQVLVAEAWPTSRPIRVRMGLHTGVCEERNGDYFGPVVNRAARLEAVAHGGQVLMSGATAELLAGALTDGTGLRDLGLHRLKDLGRPERVFQLEAPCLAANFPPLPTLDNPELPNNLPAMLSAFVGRQAEVDEVRQIMQAGRLTTLTGAGGSGKTRLALQIAAELLGSGTDGAWFADLAPVTDARQIAPVVAGILGLPDAGQATTDRVIKALAGQDVLIVMDNCEHLIDDAAKFCGEVLEYCPRVRMLVTSREPFGIAGEQVYRVPSLSLPPAEAMSTEELAGSDAARLFAERARAINPRFRLTDQAAPLVASVCWRLDGIPLALELAAARLKSMSLQQVSDRLDQRFRLLTGGSRNAMPRQQTLLATVEWSLSLLNAAERQTLLRLAVFAGGFDLAAAEAICTGDTVDEFDVLDLLSSLVDKSLVVADQDEETVRYRLLETIRQYAGPELLKALGKDSVLVIRDRHAYYYLTQAELAAPELKGRGQREWMRRLDTDWDNIQAAFIQFAATGRVAESMRLGVALERFFQSRGRTEAIGWLRRAITDADASQADVSPGVTAAALITVGWLVSFFQRHDAAAIDAVRQEAERALKLAREAGDRRTEALALAFSRPSADSDESREQRRKKFAQAVSIAREARDDHLLGTLLGSMAGGTAAEQRPGRLEALECFRRVGDDLGAATMLFMVAGEDVTSGGLTDELAAEAESRLDEAIALAEPTGDEVFLYMFLMDRSLLMLLQRQYERAEPLVRRCLLTCRRIGMLFAVSEVLLGAAIIASWRGHCEKAAQLFGAADVAISREVSEKVISWNDVERAMQDRETTQLRTTMGEQQYAKAFQAGTRLQVADAVALALTS